MAHPIKLAENAVNYFISQWLFGPKPSLFFSTEKDGSILIATEVTSVPVLSLEARCSSNATNHKSPWRRSGRAARQSRSLTHDENGCSRLVG